MRFLLLLIPLLFAALPASAQLVVPLTTPDGRVGCTQGKTGIGRPPDWRAVADPEAVLEDAVAAFEFNIRISDEVRSLVAPATCAD